MQWWRPAAPRPPSCICPTSSSGAHSPCYRPIIPDRVNACAPSYIWVLMIKKDSCSAEHAHALSTASICTLSSTSRHHTEGLAPHALPFSIETCAHATAVQVGHSAAIAAGDAVDAAGRPAAHGTAAAAGQRGRSSLRAGPRGRRYLKTRGHCNADAQGTEEIVCV